MNELRHYSITGHIKGKEVPLYFMFSGTLLSALERAEWLDFVYRFSSVRIVCEETGLQEMDWREPS